MKKPIPVTDIASIIQKRLLMHSADGASPLTYSESQGKGTIMLQLKKGKFWE